MADDPARAPLLPAERAPALAAELRPTPPPPPAQEARMADDPARAPLLPAERAAQLAAEFGLKSEEHERALAILGRQPTLTELGLFSVMWSEHCSYKSSRVWLRELPTKAPWVIQGPGENAGVIDIGEGLAAVFKMESHNHPSFIEPYQGAATGVGGILRDVFTMGARPVANLNALRFVRRAPAPVPQSPPPPVRPARQPAHQTHPRRRGPRRRRLRQLRRRPHGRRR